VLSFVSRCHQGIQGRQNRGADSWETRCQRQALVWARCCVLRNCHIITTEVAVVKSNGSCKESRHNLDAFLTSSRWMQRVKLYVYALHNQLHSSSVTSQTDVFCFSVASVKHLNRLRKFATFRPFLIALTVTVSRCYHF